MKLVVGLGNPEKQYEQTRHNVGFAALDTYGHIKELTWQTKDKFRAQVAEYSGDGHKVLLMKPQTYYNSSGEAVRAAADFYKINAEDIVIIHDELALPFGTIRTRLGGSDAGNNGVKSINLHIGQETARIRVGIWDEARNSMDDAAFVLSKFSSEESKTLPETYKKVASLIDAFTEGSFEPTTHS